MRDLHENTLFAENATIGSYKKAPTTQNDRRGWHEKPFSTGNASRGCYEKASSTQSEMRGLHDNTFSLKLVLFLVFARCS